MEDDADLLDPTRAFDQLRREVSLCTRAVQGLTAERQNIPDYSETLRSMDARLQATTDGIARMAQMPALRLTPADMAKELERAAASAREGDRKLLETVHRGNTDLAHQLRLAIQQVQLAKTQRLRLLWTAAAGCAAGIFIVLGGWWMFA